MIRIYKIVLIICLAAYSASNISCSNRKESRLQNKEQTDTLCIQSTPTKSPESPIPTKSRMACRLDSLGLIEIVSLDSTIQVKLMYADATNFTRQILYDDLKEAYLHPEAAQALVVAHKALKQKHPSYRLVVYDAARPMSVQKRMWEVVKNTPKYMYVSNPARGGGLHNYGLAVDISIVDSLGKPLPMGTEVDHMGMEAHITQESELIKQGKLTEQERQNRMILRQAMKAAGFRALPSEWWHFNLCSRETARKNYQLIP